MAHHPHPPDQDPLTLWSRQLDLTKVLLQVFKPLLHPFELFGFCSSCQQSEPLPHG